MLVSGCALTTRRPALPSSNTTRAAIRTETVAIDGVVTSSWGVPLVPFRIYKVDDGTGEVTVVSQNGRDADQGRARARHGRVSDVATFGGQSVGLHIQQTDIDFRR